MPRRRAGRIGWVRPAVGGLVLVGVGTAVLLMTGMVGGGDDGEVDTLEREGSVELREERSFAIDDEPDGYRIVYRVSEQGLSPSTEVVTVSRPFDSETTSYAGELGSEATHTVRQTTFGRLALVDPPADGDGQGERTVFAVGPVTASPDLRLAPVLADALEHRQVEVREQREVAGRRCRVHRFGTSVLGGTIVPPGDPAREYADACFDQAGLLLEEWWVVDGEPIRHRLAVEVDRRHRRGIVGDLASQAPTIPAAQGGGSIRRMAPHSAPPGRFFVTDAVPAGFERLGRFSVIPPQGDVFANPEEREQIIASTADVWRRGIDLLVVDQGSTLGNVTPFELDPDGIEVELGLLGRGEALLSLGGNEVRAVLDNGDFVRVYGTLPIADLVEVASSLVEVEGNEIVLLADDDTDSVLGVGDDG